MEALCETRSTKRYDFITAEKADGAVYTPKALADFVSQKIAEVVREQTTEHSLRILDPAIGHGELLVSLLEHLPYQQKGKIEVYGFETDPQALDIAKDRLAQHFPGISIRFERGNFLEFVLEHFGPNGHRNLFSSTIHQAYDFIIANPPYVRTQIMGAKQTQLLSEQFGLSGRIDLYYAFVLGISQVLKPQGIAGIIISNRFMTIKSGASIRQSLVDQFNIRHVWDLGDTKLFGAAVLPAVLLVQGKDGHKRETPAFTSIYQTSEPATALVTDPITALNEEGVIEVDDGRHFHVQHGTLDTNGRPDGVWRIATAAGDTWLRTVEAHSWGTFRDIGKIRVGVKTCADKIFIRDDWQDMAELERPELLRPLTTHHVARRFKALSSNRPSHILYPHEVVEGRRRAIDLTQHPRSQAYLTTHRLALEGRKYIIEAGRQWYEIWVPQDPNAWNQSKLVFRDIAEEPTFWIDSNGSVVNGDCYWLVAQNPTDIDLLWLASAIANSTFIERFYDLCFHNKLYAGRRRFITQYVENFPLPDPRTSLSKSIIAKAKQVHVHTPSSFSEMLQQELNAMVWEALTGCTSPSS
ncbi:MAG: Modification methylase PaeR7I [Verrucomicrobia subdivision 3 bacterium]|nr:Modification methylase PaeR7I [Limisphaerales bacterium]MCS1413596.1 Modification methylase PaeR7I [Limisphaerales bacterium]